MVASGGKTCNGSLTCTVDNWLGGGSLDQYIRSLLLKSTNDNMFLLVILYTFCLHINRILWLNAYGVIYGLSHNKRQ